MTRFLAALALAAAALFSTGAAEARPAALPEGSYLDSCRDLYVEGSTLYGECQNNAGKWKKTWISNYGYCDGDIYNNNGVLDCRGGRLPEQAAPSKPSGGLPAGPWTKTCRDPALDGSILRANCKDNRGTWRPTWIDLRQCSSRTIGNDDGLLVCLAAAEPPAPVLVPMRDTLPKGSWVDSCRSGVVKQYQMRAECYRATDGKWLISDVNLKTCKRGVGNRDGNLACE
ncbi:hypothetical protein sos41_16070 [Alphaproteobacteria bacterium SO-S41]|nr:hypothetical protein sos41_16070 [Alphaproteobacteria bacterium SO-S41]